VESNDWRLTSDLITDLGFDLRLESSDWRLTSDLTTDL